MRLFFLLSSLTSHIALDLPPSMPVLLKTWLPLRLQSHFPNVTNRPKTTAASEISCSFEPFCTDQVVSWFKDKKEYFCQKHAQEGTEPFQKKCRK